MKKFILSAAVVPLFSFAAYAADLPNTKGPPPFAPPPPPVFSWTGLYVGGNLGWASLDDHGSPFCVNAAGVLNGTGCETTNVPGAHVNGGGIIGGAQIGYNYQISQFVVGFETDFDGSDVRGSQYIQGPFAVVGGGLSPAGLFFTDSERLNWLGTARGRAGVGFDQFLVYATGGLAYGNATVSQNTELPGVIEFPSSASSTRVGWTAGGGVEWAFAGNWSAKVEALYYDLGSITTSGVGVPPNGFIGGKTFDVDGVIVRAGVNYKFDLFGAPAPIVAKY